MIKLDATLFKFIIVGLSNTAVSYLAFIISLNIFSLLSYKATLSQLLGYSIGILWSFIWNRSWTFKSDGNVTLQLKRFILLQLFFALTSSLLVGLLADYLHYNSHVSWLIAMSIVTVLNYWLSKNWVFKHE